MDDALVIDLYELTMTDAYLQTGMLGVASFELYVRRLPRVRNFLLAAGLEQALDYLEGFAFSGEDLEALARVGRFPRPTLEALARLRFSGDVDAVPEGTVVFAEEPLLRVTAPLPEAQLVETRLLNLLNLQTVIASKAARAVLAAAGRPLTDFGLRRAQGAEAGTLGARAAYLAGFAGTSNVRAGARFGIPLSGTMAHSFVQAHDDEAEAFAAFAAVRPGDAVMLLDTYDTERAAEKVVALAPVLASGGVRVVGVRIDSGDLGEHARKVRRVLDAGGLRDVWILASSGLDEHDVAALVASGAPIDRFAPGTRIMTSPDAPTVDCAYKLVEYDGRPRRKRSEGKRSWPGRKQVWRARDGQGRIAADHLTLATETVEGAEPLLEPVMRGGRRLRPPPPLAEARARAARELALLPEALRSLDPAPPFAVRVSSGLEAVDLTCER
jgi:nicotinate phosphoribosyltransferase